MAARAETLTVALDDCDVPAFTAIAARFGMERFGYVVTPNVDHLLRYREDPGFAAASLAATYVLFDSQFAAHWLRVRRGLSLPVCPGADVTAALFERVIDRRDRLVLIGAEGAAAALQSRYGLLELRSYTPPIGLAADAAAFAAVLAFVEAASPFRYCFLAVGSPQQELIAHALAARGRARGLALCIGGAIGFLTGAERRAPAVLRRSGLEWLYRLVHSPRRLAGRYIGRGPRALRALAATEFVLRRGS